jgi:hypothetical protein
MQRKIFISHAEVSCPKEAVSVSVDIIHPEMLKVLFAEHSPIHENDTKEVYVHRNKIYAPIPGLVGPNLWYRVEATWM